MSSIGAVLRQNWLRRVAIFLFLALSLSTMVEAMRVSPMVVEMTTAGARASARIEVQNVGAALLPFETRITRLDYDAQGRTVETPADADFLVFPPQGSLPPNARQVIRVQWVGASDLPASQSYYMSVNQLPVALGPQSGTGTGGEVQIVYHMKALITVAPPNAKPMVQVTAAEARLVQPKADPTATNAPLPAKVPGLSITVRNTGTRYAMLAGASWIIDGKGTDGQPIHLELSRDDMSKLIGVGYLGPLKGVRTFEFPTDKPFAPGSVKVRFGK
ncbi:MAG: fimbria/pilus periplasmic chaperone [Sphingomonas sp.]